MDLQKNDGKAKGLSYDDCFKNAKIAYWESMSIITGTSWLGAETCALTGPAAPWCVAGVIAPYGLQAGYATWQFIKAARKCK